MYKTKFRQRLCRKRKILPRILRIIAGRLSAAGWTLGWVSAIDSQRQTIWIVDAHRDDGRRFIVHAFFMLNEMWLGAESNRRHVDFSPCFPRGISPQK